MTPTPPPAAGASVGAPGSVGSSTLAAPLGRRAGAYAIDAVIAGLIGALAMGLGAVFIAIGGSPANAVTAAVGVLLAYLFTMAVLFAWTMVYTAMQAGTGSIGQRLLHLALADAQTGDRIGFWRALLRNIVWAAACSIVVGYFTPLFDGSARHRGWHDLASGAVVVDRAAAVPVAPPLFAAPAAVPTGPPNPFLAVSAPEQTASQTDPFFAALRGGSATASARASAPASAQASAPASAPAEDPVPVPAGPAANPFVAPAAQRATVPPTTFPTVPAGSAADLMHTDPVQDVPAAAAAPAPAPTPQVIAPAAGPALPVATSGIISSVPGASRSASAAAVPAPASPSALSAGASLVSAPDDEDLDATRASAPVSASAKTRLALVWDDGTHTAIYARTVFGRNPAADGATAVAVRDETLSLSKTHFEVDADADGTWITDRHSTNGTVVLRGGTETTLTPGERFRLQVGDRVEIGDRSVTVEAVA